MYVCVLHFRVVCCRPVLGEDGALQREPEQVFLAYNGPCSGAVELVGSECDLPEDSRAQVTVTDRGQGNYLVSFALDDEHWESVPTEDGVPVRFPLPWLDAFESWDVVASAAPIDANGLLKQAPTENKRLYTLLPSGFGEGAPYRYIDAQSWSEDKGSRDACAEFALRLVETAAAHESGNLMLSPASAQVVLGMLEEGAGGATRKEIRKVLGDADPHPLSSELPDATALKESSSLWVDGKLPRLLRQRYIDEVQRRFGADVICVPFGKEMVEALNARVAHDTDGMIAKMLEEVPEAPLLVLSCLAFSCDWKHPFEAEDITEGEFHPNPRTAQLCTMLRGDSDTYMRVNGGVGITKAYSDERFGLFALLPPKGQSPDEYLAEITGAELREALGTPYCDKDVSYELPQLSLEYGIRLNGALETLGMRRAFTTAADFGGISKAPLFVSEILQKTRFELDARGTRAAAATVAEIAMTGLPEFDRMLFIDFDRPFVLGIESTETHVPLFLGIVREVTQP